MPSSSSSTRRTVSSSSSSTRLSRLIYILIGLSTLLCAYYSYRVGKSKQETSRLWSHTSFASRMPATQGQTGNSDEGRNALIEAHMHGLAEALGIPVNELASVIANVVRKDVSSASLSSIAAPETRVGY